MKTKSRSAGLTLKTLDRNPLVLEYDNEGMDPGRYMVTLVRGWAFDGAVEEVGGDCRSTSHSSSFGRIADFATAMRWAKACRCERCTGAR